MNTGRQRRLLGLMVALGLALTLGTGVTSDTPAQANSGICDRTQEVQDVILHKLSDVSECAEVIDSNLASITGEIIILDNDELALQDGDFNGLSNMETLYIHHTGLNVLPEDVFDGLSGLTELYLYNNELTTLPGDLFDGLSSLETLSLSYNSLSALPSDVFDGLSSLTTLDLDNNSIGSLPDGVFQDLSSLEKLNLTSNSLEEVSADDFDDLTGLKDLRLADNNLGELPHDLLHELPDLQTLHLYSAGLSSLPDRLFFGLVNLENVQLHSNPGADFALTAVLEVETDGRKVFVKVPTVTPFDMELTLSAKGGSLSATTVSIAGGAYESEQIAVTTSRGDGDVVVSIDSAAFLEGSYDGIQAGMGGSQTISFPGICGRTQQVQDAILALLPGVSDCADVTDTHLAGITGDLLLNARNIETLKELDFQGLTNVTKLYLESNSLNTLPEDVFDGLSSLTELYLLRNELESLPADVFRGLTDLRWLYLNFNELQTLPDDMFKGLTNLTWLGLNGNDLGALPDSVFDDLSSLERLYLGENEIDALPDGVFAELSNLVLLDLSDNELTSLPNSVFKGMTSLGMIILQDNPGAPFTITAELEQRGEDVVVKVAEGAPFHIAVTLSVEGGTLSATRVAVPVGNVESTAVSVTAGEGGEVIINVDSATFDDETNAGLQTGVGEALTLSTQQPNNPATGAPTISGTAQVGRTLTASTSGISDDDGLTNVSYSYQWLADDTEIDGATSSTYEVQSSDNGKVIKVQVTFTDDAGKAETLTSDGTSEVVMGGL